MKYRPTENSSNLTISTDLLQPIFSWLGKEHEDLAIIIWTVERDLVYVSRTIEQILGVSPSECHHHTWTESFPHDHFIYINLFLQGKYDEKLQESNYLKLKKDTVEFTFGTITIHDKQYYICRLKSTIYINKLESQLEELQKGVIHTEKMAIAGEFSAGLIHEIRNPLTSIKGFLQLIQAGIDQKEEYYQVMIQEIEKIELITTDLLNLSKPFSQVKENVSIRKMIDDTIIIMKLQNEYEQVLFTINCDEHLTIFCNEQQIKQVLINLFKNASEAMNMNGNVIINVYENVGSIYLEIIDEGIGLSDDTIYELGKPFYTTKKSGTGLGLVVTYQILESHDAIMDISSKKGKGSKFRITFPNKKS